MKGSIIVIHEDGTMTVEEFCKPATLEDFQRSIHGGSIELVPYFTTYEFDGRMNKCVVFCDTEGKNKGLPVNVTATNQWNDAAKRAGIKGGIYNETRDRLLDYLVGTIAIVIGDADFMRSV